MQNNIRYYYSNFVISENRSYSIKCQHEPDSLDSVVVKKQKLTCVRRVPKGSHPDHSEVGLKTFKDYNNLASMTWSSVVEKFTTQLRQICNREEDLLVHKAQTF